MQITPPSPQTNNIAPSLSVGDKVMATVISNSSDKILLNVKGQQAEAAKGGEDFSGKSVKVEVLQTEPKLIVKILSANVNAKQSVQSNPSQNAALIKAATQGEALTNMKGETVIKDTASLMAKEAAAFSQKDIVSVIKTLGGARIAAFLPEEIKKVIRNSGNFFENKLLKGISPESDSKMLAYLSGNDGARSAVTKMQVANILLNTDFFTFFDGEEELDFDGGVMRFRKSPSGNINLHMKMNFTNLGETVISFVKAGDEGYYVTVRTAKDISKELAELNIPNLLIRWAELSENDGKFFEIDKDHIILSDSLNIKS